MPVRLRRRTGRPGRTERTRRTRRTRRPGRALPAARLAWQASPALLVATLTMGAASGAVAAPAALLTARLVDELTGGGAPIGVVASLAAGAALLAGLGNGIAYLAGIPASRLEARLQVRTEGDLARACAAHVGTRFLDDPAGQDRMLLARRGAHETPSLLTDSITQVVSAVSGVAAFVVVLAATWPAMLAVLAATAVPLALIQRRRSARMLEAAERAVTAYRWRDYFTTLFTEPATARDMRLHGAQRLFVGRLTGHLTTALDTEVRQQNRNTLSQFGFTVVNAVIAGSGAVIVALAVARGSVTVGGFVLFTAAVAAVQTRLVALLGVYGDIKVSLGVFGHYLDVVGSAPRRTAGAAVRPLRDGIELRDVWYRYADDADWVLRGVTLRLAAGRTHALVGLNGAGKSTLVRLLLRFDEPQRGQILWDGVDIATMDAELLRSRIAGVLQDHAGYQLTALENVTIGDPARFGDRDVAASAVRRAGIADLVTALPAGLDTMLSTTRAGDDGADGTTLSGGQWQRVALARALVKSEADLLILDEPNSGLDAVAEHRLHIDLMAMGVDRTRLLVSHRLGALRGADHIVVIGDGTVVESGSHDELMAAGGEYCRLFTIQARPYRAEELVG